MNPKKCPHCDSKIRVRTSRMVHSLLRESYLQCMNLHCGWTGKAMTEVVAELSPSGMPNNDVVKMLQSRRDTAQKSA